VGKSSDKIKMDKMEGIYSESQRLKEIVESQGWTLFDATLPKNKNRPFSWDEFEKVGCSQQFEIGHNYIFAPIPKNGETLRQAYTHTKGLGPPLLVEDGTDKNRWAGVLAVTSAYNLKEPILFSRLDFSKDFLVAFSPKIREMPESDVVGIWYPQLIDTFERYFKIVTPEKYGLKTSIPMPHRLEDN